MKKSFIISIFIVFMTMFCANAASTAASENTITKEYQAKSLSELMHSFYQTTGINALLNPKVGVLDANGNEMSLFAQSSGRIIMVLICFVLLWLLNHIC